MCSCSVSTFGCKFWPSWSFEILHSHHVLYVLALVHVLLSHHVSVTAPGPSGPAPQPSWISCPWSCRRYIAVDHSFTPGLWPGTRLLRALSDSAHGQTKLGTVPGTLPGQPCLPLPPSLSNVLPLDVFLS